MFRDKLNLVILGICTLLLAGCQTGTGDGPRGWIDMPLDRTRHTLAPIQILAHAASPQGVASFAFTIDEEAIGELSVRGGRFESADLEWTPPEAGIYTLGVVATDANGEAGEQATSILYVGDAGPNTSGFGDRMYGECEGIEYMLFEPNPSVIPSGACSILVWEVGAPEDWPIRLDGNRVERWGETPFCFELTTAVELSVETPEGDCRKYVIIDVGEDILPPPPVDEEILIRFIAAPPVITQGECAEVYWEIFMPEPHEITLDEQLVEPVGGREVCPEETTTYHLTVHSPDEPVERTATLEVLGEGEGPAETAAPGPTATGQPPDTTPPTISGASVKPDTFYVCQIQTGFPTAFNFSVNVSDPGGVANVVLDWIGNDVRDGPVDLNPIGGNQYVYSLGLFENVGDLGGFSITATDYAANSSSVTPTWNLNIENCGGG